MTSDPHVNLHLQMTLTPEAAERLRDMLRRFASSPGKAVDAPAGASVGVLAAVVAEGGASGCRITMKHPPHDGPQTPREPSEASAPPTAPPEAAWRQETASGRDVTPSRVHNREGSRIARLHPRLGRPGGAQDAATAAIVRISRGEDDPPADHGQGQPWPPEDPVAWLADRTEQYAKACRGAERRYLPTAKSWFNEQGYLQHPREWLEQYQAEDDGVPRDAKTLAKAITAEEVVAINGVRVYSGGGTQPPQTAAGERVQYDARGRLLKNGEVWLTRAQVREADIELA